MCKWSVWKYTSYTTLKRILYDQVAANHQPRRFEIELLLALRSMRPLGSHSVVNTINHKLFWLSSTVYVTNVSICSRDASVASSIIPTLLLSGSETLQSRLSCKKFFLQHRRILA